MSFWEPATAPDSSAHFLFLKQTIPALLSSTQWTATAKGGLIHRTKVENEFLTLCLALHGTLTEQIRVSCSSAEWEAPKKWHTQCALVRNCPGDARQDLKLDFPSVTWHFHGHRSQTPAQSRWPELPQSNQDAQSTQPCSRGCSSACCIPLSSDPAEQHAAPKGFQRLLILQKPASKPLSDTLKQD